MKVLAASALAILITVAAAAQTPTPPAPSAHPRPVPPALAPAPPPGVEVKPSDPQDVSDLKDLLLNLADVTKQKDDFISQANGHLAQMGQLMSQDEQAIDVEVAKIKKANGWGDEVTFNRSTRRFEKAQAAEGEKK